MHFRIFTSTCRIHGTAEETRNHESRFDRPTNTLFAAPIYRIYAPSVTKQQYQPPGFAAPLGAKDTRLALEGDDIAALGKVAAEQAGM